MSKAFTKEDDGTQSLHLDDLPQSPHPNLVTPAGFADLERRLEARRGELAGLKVRSEDTDNRYAIAVAERDIRFLEGRIARATVIDPKTQTNSGIVAFGAEVDVIAEDETRQTFRIVGEDEADPAKGLIAPYSPLGRALLGAELGSTVDWQKPSGTVELTIAAIRF